MSDSDMDIDDDDVQTQLNQHTIQPPDSHTDVKKPSDEYVPGDSGKKILVEDKILSRFPSGNGPEQKRPAIACKFYAQGRCAKGPSCTFLHVNENTNRSVQHQAVINMAGSGFLQERRPLDINGGVRFSGFEENGVTSLVNPSGGQRVFPLVNDMRFSMGRESLQKCNAVFTENRPVFVNGMNSLALASSLVQQYGSSNPSYRQTDMGSSGPPWTGSVFSSAPMNQYASSLGNFENRNNINGAGSLPMVQAISVSLPMVHAISVSSGQDAEVETTSNEKKVSSNDWEPSEPFRASFTIPPYILPSSDALYDPLTDVENSEDRSRNAPSSSKGKNAEIRYRECADSASGPQARECSNGDKTSSCSQNQYQESVGRKNLEAHGVVEATSVVDQNDATTPSKEISSSAVVENRVVLKRSKPAGHESWHRSDGSSHQKVLKSNEKDGEVRSDAGMKVMRQFRTAVVETIKEMLKPLWREGRLTKDVHNMVVKKAAEKIVSAAVQFHQVPTDTGSIEQYLSMSAPKIVKLVESYVEKYGKG